MKMATAVGVLMLQWIDESVCMLIAARSFVMLAPIMLVPIMLAVRRMLTRPCMLLASVKLNAHALSAREAKPRLRDEQEECDEFNERRMHGDWQRVGSVL
jgi:hypothetical protein